MKIYVIIAIENKKKTLRHNMDFDHIMQEITSGLTGRSDEDVAYLMKQSEKHKTHPFAKEIARLRQA